MAYGALRACAQSMPPTAPTLLFEAAICDLKQSHLHAFYLARCQISILRPSNRRPGRLKIRAQPGRWFSRRAKTRDASAQGGVLDRLARGLMHQEHPRGRNPRDQHPSELRFCWALPPGRSSHPSVWPYPRAPRLARTPILRKDPGFGRISGRPPREPERFN